MKPQYETWPLRKITGVKVTGPIETDSFPNTKFKVARGSASQCSKFTLADLPCLNPKDSFPLYNMLLKNMEKYELVMSHLKLMIQSYIKEKGEMDVEVVVILQKKPSIVLKENPKDFEKMKLGKLYSGDWFVVYYAMERSRADFHKVCFYLSDKHLYNTTFLEFILEHVSKFRGNKKDDIKCFSDRVLWYIEVRQAIYAMILKVYEVYKRIQG
ncbi:unnamed protein product [Lactuca saligna]|uniref:Uncharacterized protein n=1 Tax=Lactuca saligna TaxID=75948 RepID=A0AA35VXC5_LACSI|nr:unnamed protein product [Lactuca saligna]